MATTIHGITTITIEGVDAIINDIDCEVTVGGNSEWFQFDCEGSVDASLTRAVLQNSLTDEDLQLLIDWLIDIKKCRK